MRKAVFVISEDWYYWSHRRPLARALIERGYEVTLVTQVEELRRQIEEEGVKVEHLPLIRGSLNVFKDLSYFRKLLAVYRAIKPDLVYHVAFKPVLYGSLAAWLCGIPRRVNALAGLGYLYSSETLKVRVVRNITMAAFRLLFHRPEAVVVLQNRDDYAHIKRALNLSDDRIALIKGAGVDIDRFSLTTGSGSNAPVITHVSRLIREKGVYELISAARILKQRGLRFQVWIVGDLDEKNPNSITSDEMKSWKNEGIIEWLGWRENVDEIYARSDIAVLASFYREGLPKSLLEAAACGLPIVTTDNPGCLEVVEHQQNGLIVPMRDAESLADALAVLIQDSGLRRRLGDNARLRAETEFAEEIIVAQTLSIFGLEVVKQEAAL